VPDAIEGYHRLEEMGLDVWILSAPSFMNPSCYTEKRLWVEQYLALHTCKKIILSSDKSLLLCDFLIDGYGHGKGQQDFQGVLVHFGTDKFPDWESVLSFFENQIERQNSIKFKSPRAEISTIRASNRFTEHFFTLSVYYVRPIT